jgi:hypothetical protein
MIWIPAWRLGAARNRDAAHRRRPRLGITAFRQGKNPQRPAAKSPLLEAIGRGGVKRRFGDRPTTAAAAPLRRLSTALPPLFTARRGKKKISAGPKGGQRRM